jgi:hypothetical protein
MRCPNPACGCLVTAGDDFCPNCGHPIKGEDPGQAEVVESCQPASAPPIKDTRKTTGPTEFAPAPEEAAQAYNHATPWPALPAEISEALNCPDIEVQYNNNCVFVMNMQATFDFQIRPKVEGLKDFMIEVQYSGQSLVRERQRVVLRSGRNLHLSLNYTPRNIAPGSAAFNILVRYNLHGQPKLFAATRKHTVYSGKENLREVCNTLKIEIQNNTNIHTGSASDAKVEQDFKALDQLLGRQDSLSLDRQFLSLINQQQIWAPLPLEECETDAGDLPGGPHAALEVYCSVHQRLQLGRARECDVVTRFLDKDGAEDREASTRLSRYHACVEWRENQAVLIDRGYYPDQPQGQPSAAGVWVDGNKLAAGGECVLSPRHDYQVNLGNPGNGFEVKLRLWTVAELPPGFAARWLQAGISPNAPTCVIVKVPAAVPHRYHAFIRHGVCLGWLTPQGGKACVARDDKEGGLQLATEHGLSKLAYGQVIRFGQTDLQIWWRPQ